MCVDDVHLVCGGGDVDEFIDLERGSLAPGLTSYGSSLGLGQILFEPSTNDGDVFDPLGTGIYLQFRYNSCCGRSSV